MSTGRLFRRFGQAMAEHKNIYQRWMASQKIGVNPSIWVFSSFPAVATSAAWNNVKWGCFSSLTDRINVIPCCCRSRAIGASSSESFRQVNLCFKWNLSKSSPAGAAVLFAFRSIRGIFCKSFPLVSIEAISASGSANGVNGKPLFAAKAPFQSKSTIRLLLFPRWIGSSGTTALRALRRETIVSTFVVSESYKRLPPSALVAPLLLLTQPVLILFKRDSYAFR